MVRQSRSVLDCATPVALWRGQGFCGGLWAEVGSKDCACAIPRSAAPTKAPEGWRSTGRWRAGGGAFIDVKNRTLFVLPEPYRPLAHPTQPPQSFETPQPGRIAAAAADVRFALR